MDWGSYLIGYACGMTAVFGGQWLWRVMYWFVHRKERAELDARWAEQSARMEKLFAEDYSAIRARAIRERLEAEHIQ